MTSGSQPPKPTGSKLTVADAVAVAPTLREIGNQEIEGLTKADGNMLLPLAQKMGKIIGRSSKQIRTELVEGLGSTHGLEMARKGPDEAGS